MGFENDLLNREKYADFLTELLDNPNKYKRNSDSESMCIAIDSGWGTGKTTFINMWKEKLETKSEDYVVIKYNAWKNDFAENPLESVIYEILSHDVFKTPNEKSAGKNAAKIVLKSTAKIINSIINNKIKNVVGEDVSEIVSDVKDVIIEGACDVTEKSQELNVDLEEFYKKYEEYYEAIEKIKSILTNVAKNKKIIIIVDELDRCKPLFAIKLLESVKHIFDAKGVRFVFALDVEQLGYSIKRVYGQEMDANGYLCRFFDYISKMPAPDKENYIKMLLERNPLNKNNFSKYVNGSLYTVKIEEILNDFSVDFNLSLRDIESIYMNFSIFENIKLKKTTSCEAYSLYLFLIILKYKRIDIFNEIFCEYKMNKLKQSVYYKYTNEYKKYFSLHAIELLIKNQIIKNIGVIINENGSRREGVIYNYNNNMIRYLIGVSNSFATSCDFDFSANGIIFFDDLEIWDEIKNKRILEYIQEKLEIFDYISEISNDVDKDTKK